MSLKRNIFIVFFLLYLPFTFYSQESDKQEKSTFKLLFDKRTLSKDKTTTLRGVGSIYTGYSTIQSFPAFENSTQGGVIINEEVGLGIFISNLSTIQDKIIKKEQNESFKLQYSSNYAGIFTEYFFDFNSFINLSIPLRLGLGSVKVDSINYSNNINMFDVPVSNSYHQEREESFIFVLQPGISLNFNVLKFFIVSLGINWRYSLLTQDLKYLSINDMNAAVYNLSFRFGNFGYPSKKR